MRALKGTDTVIVVVYAGKLRLQHALIDAAKEAGVKRFVPCDFAHPCVRGVMDQFDTVSIAMLVFEVNSFG